MDYYTPGEDEDAHIEQTAEVYEDLSGSPHQSEGAKMHSIIGHRWKEGGPLFEVEWDTESSEELEARLF